jgi:hypothetical protein
LPGDEDPASDTLVMLFTAYDDVQNFEDNNGRLAGDGDWEWGTPTNVGPPSAYSGVKCWGTVLDGYRINGGGSWIYSNLRFQLDLGNDNNAVIGFWHWYEASGTTYDSLTVKINDGSGWMTLLDWYGGPVDDWEEVIVDLSAYIGTVDINFEYASRSSITDKAGWYIDDLALSSCTMVAPEIEVTPTAITGEAWAGSADYDTVTISNSGDGTLNYIITTYQDPTVTRFGGTVEQLYSVGDGSRAERKPLGYWPLTDKEGNVCEDPLEFMEEPYYPPQTDDWGGPDQFGYVWFDSDEPNGPVYNWIDISSIGTEITNWNGSVDDGYTYLMPMGMTFNYYGIDFSEIMVSTNGWVSFTQWTSSYLSNSTIPNTSNPNNFLAVLWDDQDGGSVGHCYYYYDSGENQFIVSWVNWPWYPDPTDPHDFQVIIDGDDNSILYQYGAGVYQTDISIGIENADGTDGLEVAYNSAYVHNDLAVLFTLPPLWLSSDVPSGTIAPGGGPDIVEITMDAAELEGGVYTGTVQVLSNDPDESIIDIPVTFTVNATGVDDPAENLPTEFALHQNYPNPFNPDTDIKFDLPKDSHVKLEIFNVLGQKVTTVLDEDMRAGYRSVIWNGTDNNGNEVSSGVYFYKLIAGDHVFTKKMMMLK